MKIVDYSILNSGINYSQLADTSCAESLYVVEGKEEDKLENKGFFPTTSTANTKVIWRRGK